MDSVQGQKKRKRKEKKPERIVSDPGSSEKEETLDWWDEFYKRTRGRPSPSKCLDEFETVFRMSRKTFDYICSLVKEDQRAKLGNFTFKDGTHLSLHDQVAVALRRLGSGESLGSVGDTCGLTHSTVAQVTWRFVVAMEERALHHLQWPTSKTEVKKIKHSFLKTSGLPNCCGVVDMTHILLNLRASDPTCKYCLDPQKNHSMLLQGIVDHKMRFLDIVAGWPGKLSESSVFQSANFSQLCNQGKRLNGRRLKFQLPEGSKSKIREYIVGDAGFPLLPYLITPYEGDSGPEFNKAHAEAVMVAKRALARLKDTWRIIRGVMWRPDRHKLPRIILVCCLLHNILIDMEDEVLEKSSVCSSEHDLGYKQQVSEVSDIKGANLRDKLSLYLSTNLKA